MSFNSSLHSVKRWQLSGTDYEPQQLQKLFEERMNLVLHWFDLWTDRQRKQLLYSLLARCSKSQLKYCRDLLIETVPVTHVDFTAVLPRFLSLYVMSFLSPRDLCSAAQVSWHWRVLSEQDCLWASRCIRRGWFLPYTPAEKESGAWKNHYVSCVSTLDWLTPREAAEQYGTLNQQSSEEEDERRKERRVRQMIREKLTEEKRKSGKEEESGVRIFEDEESLGQQYEERRGTLSALLTQAERAISGQRVQRMGLLAPGGTEEIHLLQGCSLSQKTLLTPDHREFWEKLSGWVALKEEGGGVDVFSPLAASASGAALMQTLSTLTGLEVRAPMGLATGSFQNILSEWSDSSARTNPSGLYVCESILQAWCRQAQWMEEALKELRGRFESQLQRAGLQARGRALGYFLWEEISLEEVCVCEELKEALMEGLARIQEESRPVEFLAFFLKRWSEQNETETKSGQKGLSIIPELQQTALDWRGAVARELHHSECVYLGKLGAVLKVYHEPLTAALSSNRAILSFADIHIILTPVAQILELNQEFQVDLAARLQQWGAEQCVGDVCVKLCSKLRAYTNYFNNYTTALHTIDKCRETKPSFRAFLKRVDRTLQTHMLSLQELLLCPAWRIQEYATLLQALSVHTPPAHPDHTDVSSALSSFLRFKEFIQKLKRNSERDRLMEETQQMIQGCPNLNEGNRQLIITQEASLLRSPDDQIPDSLRTFEHVSDVGLFLFNDALMLTRRNIHHKPFSLAHTSTHTFLASVALSSLAVREITHTRYVSHAFVLEGPCRSWVCATERAEDRETFLCVLRSAVKAALRGHQ
ncbi:epithelial cell-transforming sequence 2 oncogene-like [Halichoeres trimaculatus]|uniref:epithelial cell-transforming sequence 2 oncogene-like n=1 Tax=Halichoeres trimaculatus TaxID=147232 RepID=UPI003D9E1FB3